MVLPPKLFADKAVFRLPMSLYTIVSCVLDWLLYLFLATISIFLGLAALPSHEFAVQDISIQYTYTRNETIPVSLLVFIAVICPPFIFFVISCLDRLCVCKFRILWDTYAALTALCGSMSIQILLVCLLKNVTGLPRPDFLDRCQSSIDFGMANVAACTNTNTQLVKEGFRTFPSGHSSTAFAAMTMVSLFASGKLQVYDCRGISIKVVMVTAPMILACTVACTRIRNNRHFLSDVIVGAIIGVACSYWFYHQHFPKVTNLANKGRAYPPRRFGIAALFGQIGGFWCIKEEGLHRRCLNQAETISKLERFGIRAHEKATTISGSIELANYAIETIKGTVNLEEQL